jgi:phytanoyl-CoA hydroxylase
MSTTHTYFSRFGGLWTDRDDAAQELDRRLDGGRITEHQAELLQEWMADGRVVLEGAVPVAAIERFEADITRAFAEGDERLLVERDGEKRPLAPGTPTSLARVVDAYAYYESARELLFAPAIVDFLSLVFDAPPLLFQSLSFDKGSQQAMHQDTAYVVTSSPLELAAAWIALEDVTPGSGELMYYRGSHRLPEYAFAGERKHWDAERDGEAPHAAWAAALESNAQAMGLEREVFLPAKGDALIWAADLAHGGSPVEDADRTRKSLVGHYCPEGVQPHYFTWNPKHAGVASDRGARYASSYYDVTQQRAAGAGSQRAAGPPPAAVPSAAARRRRSGGLVGKLRGRLGRG